MLLSKLLKVKKMPFFCNKIRHLINLQKKKQKKKTHFITKRQKLLISKIKENLKFYAESITFN